MEKRTQQREVKNKKRRALLTLGLTGIVAFVVGKIFGDHDSYLLPSMQGPVKETQFSNFLITESEEEMVFADKGGEPIFIVDKESFKGQ